MTKAEIEREIRSVEREISVNRGILDCGVLPRQRARINDRLENLERRLAHLKAEALVANEEKA